MTEAVGTLYQLGVAPRERIVDSIFPMGRMIAYFESIPYCLRLEMYLYCAG